MTRFKFIDDRRLARLSIPIERVKYEAVLKIARKENVTVPKAARVLLLVGLEEYEKEQANGK